MYTPTDSPGAWHVLRKSDHITAWFAVCSTSFPMASSAALGSRASHCTVSNLASRAHWRSRTQSNRMCSTASWSGHAASRSHASTERRQVRNPAGVISIPYFSRVAAAGSLLLCGRRVIRDTIPLSRPARSGPATAGRRAVLTPFPRGVGAPGRRGVGIVGVG